MDRRAESGCGGVAAARDRSESSSNRTAPRIGAGEVGVGQRGILEVRIGEVLAGEVAAGQGRCDPEPMPLKSWAW